MSGDSEFKPLVSVLVVLTGEDRSDATRLVGAREQTWTRLEVIPVTIGPDQDLPSALKAQISECKGDYLSLLMPGAHYNPDKITRQLEFMVQLDLQDAVVYCDYTCGPEGPRSATSVLLPATDPSVLFREVYCGLPLDCSSLLIPRQTLLSLDWPEGAIGRTVGPALVLALSRHAIMVGMAAKLLHVSPPATFTSQEKAVLRDLYGQMQAYLLRQTDEEHTHDSNILRILGEAAAARLVHGLWLAAGDSLRTAWRLRGQASGTWAALRLIANPVLRSLWRRLPPGVRRLLRPTRQSTHAGAHAVLDFTAIYHGNGFVGTESLSGAGSTLFQTRVIRQRLPALLRELGVGHMLDIPCGDFHWMRELNLDGINYTGADVVEAMVLSNQQRFGSSSRTFLWADLISGPLPPADLVFCRDCLVHLPLRDALCALETIRNSSCQWLLTTTFTRDAPNAELDGAGWRALNLCLPPFNLPPPMLLINEKCTEAGGQAADKSLGLWRIADLRVGASA